MFTVNQVYLDVCDILLEPGGLQLNLVGVGDFLRYFGEVATDFLTKTQIIKKLVSVDTQGGVDTYILPDTVSDTQYGAFDQSYLYRTSTFFLDNSNTTWVSSTGTPTTWKQDEVSPKQIRLTPTPNMNGDAFQVALGQGLYGTISSTANATAVDFTSVPTGLYGTLSGFSGPEYIEVLTPMYGTIASMSISESNLETISTAIPAKLSGWNLSDTVDLVPDTFSIALRYGVLQRIFSMDGEQKDMQKAIYCGARYQEFVNMAAAIMSQEFSEAEDQNG
jgi:hypothetical protein